MEMPGNSWTSTPMETGRGPWFSRGLRELAHLGRRLWEAELPHDDAQGHEDDAVAHGRLQRPPAVAPGAGRGRLVPHPSA